MNRVLPIVFSLLALLAASRPAAAQAEPEPPTLSPQELRKFAPLLRQGGFVLYFRHLDTRQDEEDLQPVDLHDCRKQRNLSAEGIRRGKEIASAFRRLQLPVGEVLSSPFCRTVDTARLLAGKATPDADLFFAIALTSEGKARKGAALRKLLARHPGKGRNALIVGHTANLQEAVGLWPKPEGVAYVFRPGPGGGTRPVARIEPATWAAALP